MMTGPGHGDNVTAGRRGLGPWRLPLLSMALVLLVAPPHRVEWLIWVAFAPLLAALWGAEASTRRVLVWSVAVGGWYYVAVSWPLVSLAWWGWGSATGAEFAWYTLHQKLLVAGIVVTLSLWGALLWAACGWLAWRFATTPWRALWLVPSLWVLVIEWLGHRALAGMAWGTLGFHLYENPVVRPAAGLAGVWGLSFLILMVNAAVAIWWVQRRAAPVLARRVAMTAAAVVAAAVLAAGAAAPTAGRATALKVAVLQGNEPAGSWRDAFGTDGLDQTYGPMIDQALAAGADILALPETVWLRTLTLDTEPVDVEGLSPGIGRSAMGRVLASRLGSGPSLLVHGIDAAYGGAVYNAVAYWTREGLAGTYFKRFLVPFSEYRPRLVGWLSPQNRLHGSGFAYARGQGPTLVPFRGATLGTFICQEVMFDRLIQDTVRAGAGVLVTTGNDGVFAHPAVGEALHAMAVIRAAEHRRPVIRSMKTGVSAVIAPTGDVLAAAPAGVRTTITAAVVPQAGLSLYDVLGPWLLAVCGGLAALILTRSLTEQQRGSAWRALRGVPPGPGLWPEAAVPTGVRNLWGR